MYIFSYHTVTRGTAYWTGNDWSLDITKAKIYEDTINAAYDKILHKTLAIGTKLVDLREDKHLLHELLLTTSKNDVL